MPLPKPQIAVIGDLHSAWHDCDVEFFNRSEYELLLFTGDLGGSVMSNGLAIARSIAALRRRTLVMLGNNDVYQYAEITAELTYRRGMAGLMDSLQETGSDSEHPLTCGFTSHLLRLADLDVTIVAGRPFAMGGSELSFPGELKSSYGVGSLEESAARLQALVEDAKTEHLVFFAHNGPTGLGTTRHDPWGRDFGNEEGDWGDTDLAQAIAFARERGRRTLAVIAGHMHWPPRGGGERRWCALQDGTLYVNAARVPRVFTTDDKSYRQHLALTLTREGAHVREMLTLSPTTPG